MTPKRLAPGLIFVLGLAASRVMGQAIPEGVDWKSAIRTAEDFERLSRPASSEGRQVRLTKFLLPATDDPGLVGPAFQNVNRWQFHQEFMQDVWPDLFSGMGQPEYERLVFKRATRVYWAGTVSLFRTAREEFYGFSLFTDPTEPASQAEAKSVHDALAAVFDPRPFKYAPLRPAEIDLAREWQDPGFPIFTGGITDSDYVAYTQAVAYGRVRIMTLEEFEDANSRGLITWRDILVLERAPTDIEGVIAGVITAEPQLGDLSHIAIRTARRGTPNAFLAGAMEAFAPFENQLIRLEVRKLDFAVEPATPEDAEAWWRENRPRLAVDPTVDEGFATIESVLEIDLSDAQRAVSRFGGKAVNFARLQQLVFTGEAERYRAPGFGIPIKHYVDFMRANTIDVDGRTLTYEAYLRELFEEADFQASSETRFEALAAFREHARDHGRVPFALAARIAATIADVFGGTDVPVRFRSSSNAEDQLEFNGAGLYESTTGCAADSFDAGDQGPSRCNPREPGERTIERALRKVWTSLWTFRAFEERDWYQIRQADVGMGVLVTRAFLDEKANGVAFTGNPTSPRDGRFLVTAQIGEFSVVQPDPGVFPERTLLEVDLSGAVTRIDRSKPSSLVPRGERVLTDDQLRELGAVLWTIDQRLPIELGDHQRDEVLLDVEFKIDADGSMAVKQVRPFLVTIPPFTGPVFELIVPENAAVCGLFADSRGPEKELAVKSRVTFTAGTHLLTTDSDSFELDLIDSVVFGPDAAPATASGSGRVDMVISSDGRAEQAFDYTYRQRYELASGEQLEVKIILRLERSSEEEEQNEGGAPVAGRILLDDEFLTDRLVMTGVPEKDNSRIVLYRACGLQTLPLWDIRAELDDGSTIRLDERFRIPLAGSAPADIVQARVTLAGVERRVADYFHLVYAARHHNEGARFWVLLDPPITVPAVGNVHVVELAEPDPSPWLARVNDGPPRGGGAASRAKSRYLGADFQTLAEPEVTFYWMGLAGETPPRGFRRGDANSDGRVNIADAIIILNHLFPTRPVVGDGPLPCPDAADFDDDGIVELTDPIVLLSYLFRGVDIAFPPGPETCGRDPTDDDHRICEYDACGE